MTNLINADLYRLKKMKLFTILFIVDIVVSLFMVFVIFGFPRMIPAELIEAAGGYSSDLDAFKEITCLDYGVIAISSVEFISILSCIVGTILVAEDFSSGGIRNIAAKGISKVKIYFSKLFIVAIINLIFVLGYVVPSMLCALVLWKDYAPTKEMYIDELKLFAIEFLMYFAVAAIFTMVVFLVKNPAGAVSINILLSVAVGVLFNTTNFLMGGLADTGKYWIFYEIGKVASLSISNEEIIRCLMLSVIYFTIPTLIGYIVFNKKDMK